MLEAGEGTDYKSVTLFPEPVYRPHSTGLRSRKDALATVAATGTQKQSARGPDVPQAAVGNFTAGLSNQC